MKKYKFIFIAICLVAFYSCSQTVEKSGVFTVLPSPQQFDINGPGKLKPEEIRYYHIDSKVDIPLTNGMLKKLETVEDKSKAHIICSIDSLLDTPEEGYTLEITKSKIVLNGKDRAGLFYAFMSLSQLMEDAQEQDICLPVCKIKDFPLLSYRAIHLDVKHHLDKIDYYYELLDRLAGYKVNAIIAELEDKIKYKRQPVVGSADAMTIDEWRQLSQYAKERNIEISPLVQGLGHAAYILKHDQYKNLRDDPTNDWAFNPLNQETYKVQFDLYRDAMEATPYGRYLHVGGDEVKTTGGGSGKSPLELQLTWLNKVCKFAEDHGRIPIFWDDMPLKIANVYKPMFDTTFTKQQVDQIWKDNEPKLLEFLNEFPTNCVYMRWNYSTPQAYGNTKAMEWFRRHGMKVMGATAGQTRWVLMPQEESNIDNIKSFAISSINSELGGLLLTLWDDDSPLFELYFRGIIAFAEYTWAGNKRTKEEFKSAYRQREFSVELAEKKYAFIDQLEKPVAFWKNALLEGNQRNHLVEHENPIVNDLISLPDENKKGEWSKKYEGRLKQAALMLQVCDSVANKIKIMQSKALRNIYTLQVYEQVNNMARFAPEALLALNEYDEAKDAAVEAEALKKIRQLSEKFETNRNKLEQVYRVTRILEKPEGYILDQNYHYHLGNQARTFDWQFYAELLFLKKIENEF